MADHEVAAEHRLGQSLHHHSLREWLAEKRNVILLVATLIATMTFQADMNPPGGVWQDDSLENFPGSPHKAGDAVMAYNHPGSYATFYIADLIGFIASLATIFLLMTALRSRNHFISGILIGVLIGVLCLTIISVLVIVAVSIAAITPEKVENEIHRQTQIFIAIIAYCILMIPPTAAIVAICVVIARRDNSVSSLVDLEAPQFQLIENHAGGDQEKQDVLNHVNGEQKASQVELDANHANGIKKLVKFNSM